MIKITDNKCEYMGKDIEINGLTVVGIWGYLDHAKYGFMLVTTLWGVRTVRINDESLKDEIRKSGIPELEYVGTCNLREKRSLRGYE